LYSYCEGECTETRNIAGKGFALNCGGGGGGPEPEQIVITQRDWEKATSTSNYWTVYSTERFEGVRKASEPGGGHFTTVTHLSSQISGGPNYTWTPSGWSCSINNPNVSLYLGGTVIHSGAGSTFIPSNPAIFSFQQIFP
jgi:hypothetical protein